MVEVLQASAELLEFRRLIAARGNLGDNPEELLAPAFELGLLTGTARPTDQRAVMALALAALSSIDRGSTELPLDLRLEEELEWIQGDAATVLAPRVLADQIRELISTGRAASLIGGPDASTPLVLTAGGVALARVVELEERVAAMVAARLRSAAIAQDTIDDSRRTAAMARDSEIDPARAAATSRLFVITGGPGSGKTTLAGRIVDALVAGGTRPEAIALAAPTGKAAERLGQALARQLEQHGMSRPSTLHRLLGIAPSGRHVRYHQENRLPLAALIVDEASMIDLELFARMLDALPDDARFIVLGDADQLPAIAAGAVLRDLVEFGIGVHRLQGSFRQDTRHAGGAAIRAAAQAVQQGARELAQRPAQSVDAIAFSGLESITEHDDAPHQIASILECIEARRWRGIDDAPTLVRHTYRIEDGVFSQSEARRIKILLDAAQRDRILTVTRIMERGSVRVNQFMHELHARRFGYEDQLSFAVLAGEPVLVTTNDSLRGLANGDTGLALWVAERGAPPRLHAVFEMLGGIRAFPLAGLGGRLELAHAITVHKSQGSEYECVALLLPDQSLPMFTRELIYTAITRASTSALIIGDPAILNRGLLSSLLRRTALVAAIARAMA